MGSGRGLRRPLRLGTAAAGLGPRGTGSPATPLIGGRDPRPLSGDPFVGGWSRRSRIAARNNHRSNGVSPRPGGDMSSVTTPPSVVPSPSPDVPPRSIPSLDELYEWTSEPDHRVVIRGVDWAFYEQLVDSIPEGANLHVDYDGKDLEIMSQSQLHDGIKKRLGRFVELTAEELEIPCTGLGQATWKRPEVTRGLEADECYYFAPEKLVVAAEAMMRMSMDG